jgi:predicted small metal-binding protein|tara:strand:- start:7497 stop:8015 length:519 start_codon:yes stop_codon:yes gene_type:complete
MDEVNFLAQVTRYSEPKELFSYGQGEYTEIGFRVGQHKSEFFLIVPTALNLSVKRHEIVNISLTNLTGERKKIFDAAAKHLGYISRFTIVAEELSELIVQLMKAIRNKHVTVTDVEIDKLDEILNEHADCEVVLDQLKFLMGQKYSDKLLEIKEEKIQRLKQRLMKNQRVSF